MTKENFFALIDKYLEGKATLQEEQTLLNFYESFNQSTDWDEKALGLKEELEAKMLARLHAAIRQPAVQSKTIAIWKRIAVAASIVLVSSIIFYSYQQQKEQSTHNPKTAQTSAIVPGTNRAFLTLADGEKIALNEAANKVLAAQLGDGVAVKEGTLSYATNLLAAKDKFNLIEIPRGGQYRVDLPDGSKVWLNAESSLRYPLTFDHNERKVTLTGEAYFEIAKDKNRPFKVVTGTQTVEVLGTHFNVSAYQNDDETKTTLLEGSVRITKNNGTGNDQTVVLRPDEEAINYNAKPLQVRQVDAEQSVAWKNGNFIFEHEDISSIMKKIARWYDIEISYAGSKSTDLFTGTISRKKSLNNVLEMLQLAGNVHFKVEGRRIVVLP